MTIYTYTGTGTGTPTYTHRYIHLHTQVHTNTYTQVFRRENVGQLIRYSSPVGSMKIKMRLSFLIIPSEPKAFGDFCQPQAKPQLQLWWPELSLISNSSHPPGKVYFWASSQLGSFTNINNKS